MAFRTFTGCARRSSERLHMDWFTQFLEVRINLQAAGVQELNILLDADHLPEISHTVRCGRNGKLLRPWACRIALCCVELGNSQSQVGSQWCWAGDARHGICSHVSLQRRCVSDMRVLSGLDFEDVVRTSAETRPLFLKNIHNRSIASTRNYNIWDEVLRNLCCVQRLQTAWAVDREHIRHRHLCSYAWVSISH